MFDFLAGHGPDPTCDLATGAKVLDYGWQGIDASEWPVPSDAKALYAQFLVVDQKNCGTVEDIIGAVKMRERFYYNLYMFNPKQHAKLIECESSSAKCLGPDTCIGYTDASGRWKTWFGQ